MLISSVFPLEIKFDNFSPVWSKIKRWLLWFNPFWHYLGYKFATKSVWRLYGQQTWLVSTLFVVLFLRTLLWTFQSHFHNKIEVHCLLCKNTMRTFKDSRWDNLWKYRLMVYLLGIAAWCTSTSAFVLVSPSKHLCWPKLVISRVVISFGPQQ